MSTTHTTITARPVLSTLARKLVFGLVLAGISFAMLQGTSEAHKISYGRAMATAERAAELESRELADYMAYNYGGYWYASDWSADNCRPAYRRYHRHSVPCETTVRAVSSQGDVQTCFQDIVVRFTSRYSYATNYSVLGYTCA